jgi:hypothetical protein
VEERGPAYIFVSHLLERGVWFEMPRTIESEVLSAEWGEVAAFCAENSFRWGETLVRLIGKKGKISTVL